MSDILDRIAALDPGAPRPPPDPMIVIAYQEATGTAFRPDYLAFLERVNGAWLPEVAWDDALDDLGHASRAMVVYGIGTGDPRLDQPVAAGGATDLGFYDLRFYPHGYMLGVDEGDNPIVQVARGREAGAIKWVDHEYWHGGMAPLLGGPDAGDAYSGFGATGWNELTTDELWERAAEYGWARTSAPDLTALFVHILARQA